MELRTDVQTTPDNNIRQLKTLAGMDAPPGVVDQIEVVVLTYLGARRCGRYRSLSLNR